MKKISVSAVLLLAAAVLFSGCSMARAEQEAIPAPAPSRTESIPFLDDQLYAAAYVGYQELDDLTFYVENYLDSGQLPIHYLSAGEYYLIIPRYQDMALSLYRNDIQTGDSVLIFQDGACRPFLIQCNASDIFADATISLSYGDETAVFSPCISLMDGSVLVGERGLDLTGQG